jgi:sigma-E factor negative regulatory protein RseB
VAVATVATAGAGTPVPSGSTPAPGRPDPLSTARRASTHWDFDGELVVTWLDGSESHRTSVALHAASGVVRLEGSQVVAGDGHSRMVRTSKGWRALWSGSAGRGPELSEKYRAVALRRRDAVAGRPARWWEIRVRDGGHVRQRVALDAQTGLLLRREELDDRGRVVRTVAVESLTVEGPASVTPSTLPRRPVASAPVALRDVPDRYSAPRRAGDGFERVGMYRRADGPLQLTYSDGLEDVSVFEERGPLDWSSLPGGGRRTQLDGHEAMVWSTPSGSVAVWERDGIVYTCVAGATWSEMQHLVDDFPSDDGGVLARVGRFVTGPFSWD